MSELGQSLGQLWDALRNLFSALADVAGPWIPLLLALGSWVLLWTCAVNWIRLRSVLLAGGWIGLLLIAVVAVMVWGAVDPPQRYALTLDDGSLLSGTLSARTDETVTIFDGAVEATVPVASIVDSSRYHSLLGLRVSNYVGKTVYVTGLLCIMLLCGSLQLGGCCRVEDETPVELHAASAAH